MFNENQQKELKPLLGDLIIEDIKFGQNRFTIKTNKIEITSGEFNPQKALWIRQQKGYEKDYIELVFEVVKEILLKLKTSEE